MLFFAAKLQCKITVINEMAMVGALNGKKPKDFLDPLRYSGFLPGALPALNLQKKRFYKLLVRKGLVYMHHHGYDVDPDSPILRSEPDEDVCNDEEDSDGEEDHKCEEAAKFVVSVY